MKSTIGFTLVELLVVITIVVILLALLTPALDRAVEQAERAMCLVNQRTLVLGCQTYAVDERRLLPPYTLSGVGRCSAWDLRTAFDDGGVRKPMGVGLLVARQLLPSTKLGKVIHCPTMNTMVIPVGNPGHNMDVDHGSGAGGSWWVHAPYANSERIIPGFNYRAASYYQQGTKRPDGTRTGAGHIKLVDATSSFIVSSDTLDYRVGIRFVHQTGYQMAYGDGHATWYPDAEQKVEKDIIGQRNVDGTSNPWVDEDVYDHFVGKP